VTLDTFERTGLILAAVIFATVACIAAFVPTLLFGPIEVSWTAEPAGPAELRAAYLGLFGSAGVLFAVGARNPSLREVALWGLGLILTGFVAGRILSLALDGVPNPVGWANLSVEGTGLVLTLAVLQRRRVARPESEGP
jgi:hypothetical protein